jgi:ribonuclease P protein component
VFRFPKSRRLLKTTEFDRVFQQRRSQGDGTLVVYACENDLGYSRLGMVVSRKTGGAALRARWKRCIREAFRLAQHELPPGLDLVTLPRPDAVPTTPRVQQSLQDLAVRLAQRMAVSLPPGEAPPS